MQSEDFYPTLLEALQLPAAPGQRFDGISLLRAWKGESFDRGPVFKYFPHDPPVPDWLPPAVSVHRGDWKLMQNDPFRPLELYHLKTDPQEKTNLAAGNKEMVNDLVAALRRHIQRGGATAWQKAPPVVDESRISHAR